METRKIFRGHDLAASWSLKGPFKSETCWTAYGITSALLTLNFVQDTDRSDGAESSDHKSAGEDCRKSIRAGSVKKRKGEEVSVKRSSFVFLLQGISESAPADCFCPNRNLTKS